MFKNDEEIIPDIILWSKMLEEKLIATAQNTYQGWNDLGVFAPETNARVRRAELSFLKNIFDFVNYQGHKQLQVLKTVQDKLPIYSKNEENNQEPLTSLLHPQVRFVIQGLIVPELRDDIWRIQFADELADKIIGQSFYLRPELPQISIPLDQNSKGYLARRLREIIR